MYLFEKKNVFCRIDQLRFVKHFHPFDDESIGEREKEKERRRERKGIVREMTKCKIEIHILFFIETKKE